MRRPICSPRAENLVEIAQANLEAGRLPTPVAERFRQTLTLEPQRGAQDFGLGLCGRGTTRLARRLGEVSCEDCLLLLQTPSSRSPDG